MARGDKAAQRVDYLRGGFQVCAVAGGVQAEFQATITSITQDAGTRSKTILHFRGLSMDARCRNNKHEQILRVR